MRPLLPGDIVAAARVLMSCADAERDGRARQLLHEADAADRLRKDTGRAHALWGNGTLMAAALRHDPPPEPGLDDPDYLDCLIRVLLAVRARCQPDAQAMQRVAVGSRSRRPSAIASPQSSH